MVFGIHVCSLIRLDFAEKKLQRGALVSIIGKDARPTTNTIVIILRQESLPPYCIGEFIAG